MTIVRTSLCPLLGIEHPIVGFSPSEHVAAAISRAGGLGVLGCVRFNDAAELDAVLTWMDENTGGKPYGVDVVMPARMPAEGTPADLDSLIPEGHREFVENTLLKLGVPPLPDDSPAGDGVLGWLHSVARQHVEVALAHPARLIANALGPPPPDVISRAHERGMLVAALAGKAGHARGHVASGVDIVVAQGFEAGGHTGEIASMVLIPEIVDTVGADAPVLAAGGIGCGRQIAAALALGAVGVWMGSAWLTTQEYAITSAAPAMRDALLAASGVGEITKRAVDALKPGANGAEAQPLDAGLDRTGRARTAPHATAEPAGQRGAPAADALRQARRGADAGGPDRRPDERGPLGGRGHDGPRRRNRRGAVPPQRPPLTGGPCACPPLTVVIMTLLLLSQQQSHDHEPTRWPRRPAGRRNR